MTLLDLTRVRFVSHDRGAGSTAPRLSLNGKWLSSRVKTISNAKTGTHSIVERVQVQLPGGKSLWFVLKRPTSKMNALDRAALMHERRVFAFVTRLVNAGVCPFFLRSLHIPGLPRGALASESFRPSLMTTLHKALKDNGAGGAFAALTTDRRQALALLISLVYTVEVMRRVGLRHNDLHLNNVLVVRTPPTDIAFTFRTRTGKWRQWTLTGVRFRPLIFDFDRATKLPPDPNVRLRNAWNFRPPHDAVTNRFHWHDPTVRTEKMNMFKLAQLIRYRTSAGTPLGDAVRATCYNDGGGRRRCLSITSNEMNVLSPEFDSKYFDEYLIPFTKTKKEVVPWWTGSTEHYLEELVAAYDALSKNRTPRSSVAAARQRLTASMRPLYD